MAGSGAAGNAAAKAGSYGPPAGGASRDFSAPSRDYGASRDVARPSTSDFGNRAGGSAFLGYNSGRSASMASSRGSMSRGFSGGGGRRR